MARRSVNLAQVAASVGVSTMTASRALRGSDLVRAPVREAVIAAAKKLGYRGSLLPSALAGGSLPLIAIEAIDLDNPFFGGLVKRVVRATRSAGFRCTLCDGIDDLVEFAKELPLRGAILLAAGDGEPVHLGDDTSCITLGSRASKATSRADVCVDLHPAYRELTERLIEQGRRRIAIFCPDGYYDHRLKFSTVQSVMRARGLACVDLPSELVEKPSALARALTNHPGMIDALFCRNDQIAAEVAFEFHRAGIRIPDHVQVIGCDGLVRLPGIWSVAIDLDEIARCVVDLLLKRLHGAPKSAAQMITPRAASIS